MRLVISRSISICWADVGVEIQQIILQRILQKQVGGDLQGIGELHHCIKAGLAGAALDMPEERQTDAAELREFFLRELRKNTLSSNTLAKPLVHHFRIHNENTSFPVTSQFIDFWSI